MFGASGDVDIPARRDRQAQVDIARKDVARDMGGRRGGNGDRPLRADRRDASDIGVAFLVAGLDDISAIGIAQRIAGKGLENLAPRLKPRSEEHTSELQSLMRISYAVFCLKNKNKRNKQTRTKS